MTASDVDLVRGAWAAFARGDVDVATGVLDAHVRWYSADGETDDGCQNREQALTFIRQALEDGVTAEALDVRDAGDRVVVIVQPRQPPEWGEPPGPHGEVVTVRDGKVTEMVVHPTVEDALASVGLTV